jgi:O-antigen/teichoic acid export membrane protein
VSELRRGIVRGVAWNALSQVGNQVINLGITVLLTRILPASTFGLIAMAGVFTGFFLVFPGLGLGAALVQKADAEERHFTSVYWVNLLFSFFLAALVALAGPVAAWFFREPALVPILGALAFQFPITAIAAISRVRLRRELRFDVVSRIELLAGACGGACGVVLALDGAGVWSLVVRSLVVASLSSLLLSIAKPFRPSPRIDWPSVRECSGFGLNMIGGELLVYFFRSFDNLLIGKYLGAIALGVYSRAYAFMLVPLIGVTQVISGVLFPALSRIKNEDDRLSAIFLRVSGAIALVVHPLSIWFVVAAGPFVRVVLGPRWEDVVPLLQILCPAGLWECFGGVAAAIFQAKGRTDLYVRVSGLSYGFAAVAFFVGVRFGLHGVATAYVAASAIIAFPALHVARKLVGLELGVVLRHVAGVLGLAIVSGVVSFGTLGWASSRFGSLGQLIATTCAHGLSYALLVALVRPAPARDVLALLRARRAEGAA